jgi:signal transduction histidine kinase
MRADLESLLLAASRSTAVDDGRLEETYRLVLQAVCEGLSIARAGVWLLLPDRSGIRCALLIDRAHGTEDESLVLTRSQFPRYFAGLDTERAILAHEAVDDPCTAEFTDSYLRPLGIGSMLDVPVRHRGEMVGIICCEHVGAPRCWSSDEAGFAGALADLVGRAITANRQVEAERALRALNASLETRVAERTAAQAEALAEATRARREAELANLAKTRFLANMSHELRTPLNAIIGYADLLREDLPGERRLVDVAAELEAIGGSAAHLLALINDVLDIAQIESGNLHLEPTACELAPLCAEVLATVRLENERRGNQLVVDVGCATLVCDLRSTRQILVNLIGNATKFTSGGRVELCVRDEGDAVAFAVSDTGIGIAAEHLGALFVRFYQVDSSPTRRHGGTGLGLSISRALAEAMGGSLGVTSEPGRGSTFTLRLPQRRPAAGG